MTIRRATTADADSILDCLRTAFEPFRSFYSPQGFADTVLTPETIHHRLASMTIFVATNPHSDNPDNDQPEQIVGTIACNVIEKDHGHIRGMAVLPEWQGRGVAEQLLKTAECELAARGCIHVTLDTTQPLQRAIRFYERNGYHPSGKVGDHFGLPLFEYVKTL